MNASRRRLTALYTAGALLPVVGVVAVLIRLPAGPAAAPATPGPAAVTGGGGPVLVTHALAVVAVLVIVAHLGGAAAHRLRQPRVIGQAAAGLTVGPSLLGHLAPPVSGWLHAGSADQAVDLLAQLGVILFVFLIAQQLSTGEHRAGAAAVVVGHTMVAVPLLAGVATAVLLLPGLRPAHTGVLPYSLFIGLAMSATALPVLAHILTERRQLTSALGSLGTAAAAVGDAAIWCALAVALCLAGSNPMSVTLLRLAAALGFAAAIWWGLRPLLHRLMPPGSDSRHTRPALLLAVVLLAAVATENLGLHAIFGAFLLGLAVPRRSLLVQRVTASVDGVTRWLLLPLFFTAIGTRTHLEVITSPRMIGLCAIVLAVAVAGKLAAAGGAGRALGLSWRDSTALGVMMNCRGLTELVLLTIGLNAGIIDERTFTVFVIMALLTTAATGPLLSRLGLPRPATTTESAPPVTATPAQQPTPAPAGTTRTLS